MANIDDEIRQLAKAIYGLMIRSEKGWVSWKQVSRHLPSSAEEADMASSLASLPQYQHLFEVNQYKGKLTGAGIEFVRSLETEEKPLLATIADAIIHYASQMRLIFLEVKRVSVLVQAQNKFVHAVYVELSDEVFPTETPVEIKCLASRPVLGKIVGQEPDGDVLYIACDSDISEAQLPNKLIIDRAFLLTQLAIQLRNLPAFPERMQSIFEKPRQSIIADPDSMKVAEQLAQLKAPWTRFLWGPPGSGKTHGLGHFVAKLMIDYPGETVLIVAPSNRAVDVAVNLIQRLFSANCIDSLIHNRRVLRFGYPRKTEVLEVPELLGPANLDELSRTVHKIAGQIAAAEQTAGKDSSSKLAFMRANLLASQEAVKDALNEHVAQCLVVATTSTLAYMPKSPVATRMWDTVIVDEVTMVPPAICAFLASRAKKRFLLAGDPCQLGPVYEDPKTANENSEFWLKKDIFSIASISSGKLTPDAINVTDSRLVRITAQRRCATGIWNKVSHLYPEVTNATYQLRLQRILDLPPVSGFPVALVDLSSRDAKCEKMKRSWHNMASARIAMHVAATIASDAPANFRIAIICPYRAQVKLLRQWIRVEQKAANSPFGESIVEAGTVHQFQGSEAGAVVFDLVDGPGRKNLGLLLRGDTGTRLVNVAISRAKGKLVVIANRDWCRKADISVHNALLSKLIFGGDSTRVLNPSQVEKFKLEHFDNNTN